MNQRFVIYLCFALLLVVFDQISKFGISHSMTLFQSQELLSWLNLMYVHNTGAAFSLFADLGWQRWFLVFISLLCSVIMIYWLWNHERNVKLLNIAIVLVLGGAVGNLIDRVAFGYVIDFISVHYKYHYFPTFNIADSAISVGAFLFVVSYWLEYKKAKEFKKASKGNLKSNSKK